MTRKGFTLVELMIVVVIIGILASLAIYGVRKYVANSKTAEARLGVGAISKAAMSAYEGERMNGALLGVTETVGSARRICTSAANPSMPFLMSVTPAASHTRVPEGSPIIVRAPRRAPCAAPGHPPGRAGECARPRSRARYCPGLAARMMSR